MEDFSDCYFLDEPCKTEIPVFFVYDRTSSLDEGDDPKKALLYPLLKEDTADEKLIVTSQINLITTLILFSNKLEFELGRSLPVNYKLGKVHFYLLNVGKYTFSLRRPCHYPENSAISELEVIYFLFTTFYEQFTTSGVHTTRSHLENNPDVEKARSFDSLLQFLSKINRTQLAICVGSWSFQTSSPVLDEAERKLAVDLSLLVESTSSSFYVVGSLAMLNGKVVFTKNLKSKFVQTITLIINGDLTEFGKAIEFGDAYDVTALVCHLTATHVCSTSNQDFGGFYGLIHIRGDLSLTLVVKCPKDPLIGDWFQSSWKRCCTGIRHELFRMYHELDNMREMTPTSSKEYLPPSVESVRLHKHSNVVYANSSRSLPPASPDPKVERKKGASAPGLAQLNQGFADWYTKSLSIVQQAFCDMPSISEIRMASASEFVLHSTQSPVSNRFVGSTDPRALSAAIERLNI